MKILILSIVLLGLCACDIVGKGEANQKDFMSEVQVNDVDISDDELNKENEKNNNDIEANQKDFSSEVQVNDVDIIDDELNKGSEKNNNDIEANQKDFSSGVQVNDVDISDSELNKEMESKEKETITTIKTVLNNPNMLAQMEVIGQENIYVYKNDKFESTTSIRYFSDLSKAKEQYYKISGMDEYEDVKLDELELKLTFTLKAENDETGVYSRYSVDEVINMMKGLGYSCEVEKSVVK